MVMLLIVGIFMTVFLLLMAMFTTRGTTDVRKEKRVRQFKLRDGLKSGNDRLKALLIRKKKPTKKKNHLAQKLSVAGVPMKVEEFIAFQWILGFIIGGILYLVTNQLLMIVIGFLLGYKLLGLWLSNKEKKRIKQFNEGLPNMLTSMIGSLRAGFSFVQSLQLVAEESYSPIKEEVALVLKAMQYGTSLEDALLDWKERMPSEDLELLVEAILIQRQVGGNLAYLLNKIVETTRERTKLENQIKTLTAQGRLSGIIIGILPVALGLIIYVINPAYMTTLFTNPIGLMMVGVALVSGVIGFILVQKITTIEV
ncbi:type II secretion system F family protein [Oceanobacillus halotolerans]|uniref:type II secretion system F family protein n=1 Tax=Oceanobacillus halotolerans TaxID=2663380 RepID=UPI0013DCA823|nr:type II secretion system F family protein [Oceanobacillus halotolerans]